MFSGEWRFDRTYFVQIVSFLLATSFPSPKIMPAPPKHITILGGGLSGLSTAYHLSRTLPASTKISLVEGTSRVGGWIDSQKHEVGFRDREGQVREGVVGIETGPRSIRPRGSRGAASMLKMVSACFGMSAKSQSLQAFYNELTLDL